MRLGALLFFRAFGFAALGSFAFLAFRRDSWSGQRSRLSLADGFSQASASGKFGSKADTSRSLEDSPLSGLAEPLTNDCDGRSPASDLKRE